MGRGVWTFYDENGIKERETEHKSGKEDGIYSLWYDNGQKKEEGPYLGTTRIGTYWLTKIFRENYDLYACSGILFNHESPLRSDEFVTKKEY